jgi:hypothetical protein
MLALNGYFNTLDMSNDAEISAIKPMQASKVALRQSSAVSGVLTIFAAPYVHRMAAWRSLVHVERWLFIMDLILFCLTCWATGNHHLAWSVPMSDPSYNIMGAGIHRRDST